MRTHYDNLKVSQDAPVEVIQAAYRTLAKKYHPDLNRDNPDAEKIMQILNEAYEVLSDPVRRKEHDSWIARKNWERRIESSVASKKSDSSEKGKESVSAGKKIRTVGLTCAIFVKKIISVVVFYFLGLSKRFLLIGLAGGVVYFFSSEDGYFRSEVGRGVSAFFKKITPQEVDIPSGDVNVKPWEYITSNNEKTSVNYISDGACGGPVSNWVYKGVASPWPEYPQVLRDLDKRKGLSSLTLDNTRNNQRLWVKLSLAKDSSTTNFVREAFIPAGRSLVFDKINAGDYVVKVKDIDSGCAQISEVIGFVEREIVGGTEYSDSSLTFYPVVNGNTHFNTLPNSQF